jgi:hypothetical protein
MKYFYEEDSIWQSTENLFVFRCKCSVFGTNSWCVDDCPLEVKHSHPDQCEHPKKRHGFKEIYTFLKSKKGLISIGSLIAIKIIINLTVNVSWDYEIREGEFNHKKAKFKIAIVTQEYRWKFENSDSIETGSIKAELPELLDDLKGFNKMIGLIGVGTASQEGIMNQEVSRADRRADNIVAVFRQTDLASNKEIYKLNLGQYLVKVPTTSVAETSVQRRVIIIGILQRDNAMNFDEMKEALKDALQKSSLKYTVDTKSYSILLDIFEKGGQLATFVVPQP